MLQLTCKPAAMQQHRNHTGISRSLEHLIHCFSIANENCFGPLLRRWMFSSVHVLVEWDQQSIRGGGNGTLKLSAGVSKLYGAMRRAPQARRRPPGSALSSPGSRAGTACILFTVCLFREQRHQLFNFGWRGRVPFRFHPQPQLHCCPVHGKAHGLARILLLSLVLLLFVKRTRRPRPCLANPAWTCARATLQ